ncbi:hypothetical protein [Breoghania sp.]|uniref:hypothetical protein n=1 Tax=Breoghania sp. TaxID=2065378 RepID=UPI002AA67802|nr:hypothetical protein [Breoghania sp.]
MTRHLPRPDASDPLLKAMRQRSVEMDVLRHRTGTDRPDQPDRLTLLTMRQSLKALLRDLTSRRDETAGDLTSLHAAASATRFYARMAALTDKSRR